MDPETMYIPPRTIRTFFKWAIPFLINSHLILKGKAERSSSTTNRYTNSFSAAAFSIRNKCPLVKGLQLTTMDATDVVSVLYFNDLRSVSYTHLRAHETDSYLVCRLLLEKK